MGMWRTHEDHVRHSGQLHVADIESASLHKPVEIRPWHRFADIRVRPVEQGKGFSFYNCHGCCPLRRRAVAATASTIAW